MAAASGVQSATTTSSCASATRPSSTATPTSPRGAETASLAPGDDDAFELHGRGRDGLVDHVHALEQIAELVLPEHLLQTGTVRWAEDELGRIAVERQVAPHRRKHLRGASLVGVLAKRAAARRREVVHVLEHAFERAVLRDELPGGLVPDAGDPGDVVGGVALQPDEVRHLLGCDAVAGEDAVGRVDVDVRDSARSHHQRDVVADELERVTVGRDNRRLEPGLVRARGQGGDDVVRLPALELEVPVAEGLDDRAEVRELLGQEVRHRPPVDLVLGIELLTVGRARVPCDRDALRPVVGEELEEHVREAQQGVRREALARRELLREREIGAVSEIVSVDEEELGVARGAVVELELSPCQRLR